MLQLLLKQNIMLTVLIHVLQEVHSGLIFTSPLRLSSIPLLFVLKLGELVNMTLVGVFVALLLVVVLLQFLDLMTASKSLCLFEFLNGTLLCQGLSEKNFITVEFHLAGSFMELLLGGVVRDELEVALTVKNKLLLRGHLLLILLNNPLLT